MSISGEIATKIDLTEGQLNFVINSPGAEIARETGEIVNIKANGIHERWIVFHTRKRLEVLDALGDIGVLKRLADSFRLNLTKIGTKNADKFAWVFCHIYNLVEPICKMEQLEFLEDDFKDTDLSSFILHVGDSSLNFGALQSEGATNRIWWIEWDLETLKFTNKLVAESNGSKMDIKNALEPFKSTQ